MPIYEYQAKGERQCALCAAGFELLRKIDDRELSKCPQCDAPVVRKISAPNINSAGPSMNESNIEKHGFTQYKKLEKGVYEKTAGKGPDIISDD